MALYSTIDRRIWTDKKFCAFSDDTKFLWMYFLTCPETNSLPGVLVTGKAHVCETLKWSAERFDKSFQELFKAGLVKADFEARLVWLCKALKYRAPANPNVVIGWNDAWDHVPECELKDVIDKHFTAYFPSRGNNFKSAWEQLPSRSVNSSGNGMPNQEQEQEQEQESDSDSDLRSDRYSLGASKNKRQRKTPPAVSDPADLKDVSVDGLTATADRLFSTCKYQGHDGAIFWQAAALLDAGLISEDELWDAAEGTKLGAKSNKPGYFKVTLAAALADPKRKRKVDLESLLARVRITPACPKSAPGKESR